MATRADVERAIASADPDGGVLVYDAERRLLAERPPAPGGSAVVVVIGVKQPGVPPVPAKRKRVPGAVGLHAPPPAPAEETRPTPAREPEQDPGPDPGPKPPGRPRPRVRVIGGGQDA